MTEYSIHKIRYPYADIGGYGSTILRKGLFLILILTLSFVPVFQATHALTHVDIIGVVQADDPGQNELDPDSDLDRICLDCLALTAFSIIPLILPSLFLDPMMRQLPPLLKSRHTLLDFSSPYLTRAPPLA
ncbi:hypothetical protein [Nitrosospira sp. NpAV]|uniref:hypothetical protein n=1 Tax=Nitrosospira sp. NpAV TaxID=58133 RepID=UPI000697A82E|nr:hypothetical protein [Nitrosospira sp. NpAV]